MKARTTTLLSFLNESAQIRIPIYQRTYSWTEKECEPLWDDILRTGKGDKYVVVLRDILFYLSTCP